MQWSQYDRVSPRGDIMCARCVTISAKWHRDHDDAYYCATCRDEIVEQEVRDAASAVVAFDWPDNDPDAVAAMDRLRKALQE